MFYKYRESVSGKNNSRFIKMNKTIKMHTFCCDNYVYYGRFIGHRLTAKGTHSTHIYIVLEETIYVDYKYSLDNYTLFAFINESET